MRFLIYDSASNALCVRSIKSNTYKGAYTVQNYRITVDFFAHHRCTGGNFHEIMDFRHRHVSEIQNTEQNLLKLPYHRPKNCQVPITVISYAPPYKIVLPETTMTKYFTYLKR